MEGLGKHFYVYNMGFNPFLSILIDGIDHLNYDLV